MNEQKSEYETMPKYLPYKLVYDINKDEWGNLIKHVKDNKLSNVDANVYMWRHLYKMNSWIVINLSAGMRPFAGVVAGNPSLLLFTSEKIAMDFIKSQKFDEQKRKFSLDRFLIPSTLSFLEEYQSKGITWVNFNQGTKAPFGGPINLLEIGYKWHLQNDPSFVEK